MKAKNERILERKFRVFFWGDGAKFGEKIRVEIRRIFWKKWSVLGVKG